MYNRNEDLVASSNTPNISDVQTTNTLPNDSVAKLEKLIAEFDKNIQIVNFEIETETFYDLTSSGNNIRMINNILADSSRIVSFLIYIKSKNTFLKNISYLASQCSRY